MHWPLAISRNLDALRAVVAAIGALLAGHDQLIARRLRNAAFAMLRPAEAAARRLIVIAARGLVLAASATLSFAWAGQARAAADARIPAFRLFDPKGRFPRLVRVAPAGIPRIRTFWGAPALAAPPPPPAPRSHDPAAAVGSARLRLRLAALEAALADLPRQARRLARWPARWQARHAERGGPPSRCASAGRRAGARGPARRSTTCCATAMRSRSMLWLTTRGRGPTRPESASPRFLNHTRLASLRGPHRRGRVTASPRKAPSGHPMTCLPVHFCLRTIGFVAVVLVGASLGRVGPQSAPQSRVAAEPVAFVSYAGGAETIEALFH